VTVSMDSHAMAICEIEVWGTIGAIFNVGGR
jgi:hypothetical protein